MFLRRQNKYGKTKKVHQTPNPKWTWSVFFVKKKRVVPTEKIQLRCVD